MQQTAVILPESVQFRFSKESFQAQVITRSGKPNRARRVERGSVWPQSQLGMLETLDHVKNQLRTSYHCIAELCHEHREWQCSIERTTSLCQPCRKLIKETVMFCRKEKVTWAGRRTAWQDAVQQLQLDIHSRHHWNHPTA